MSSRVDGVGGGSMMFENLPRGVGENLPRGVGEFVMVLKVEELLGLLLPETPNSLIERGYLQKVLLTLYRKMFHQSLAARSCCSPIRGSCAGYGDGRVTLWLCVTLCSNGRSPGKFLGCPNRLLLCDHHSSLLLMLDNIVLDISNSRLQGRAVLESIRGTTEVDAEYGTIASAHRRYPTQPLKAQGVLKMAKRVQGFTSCLMEGNARIRQGQCWASSSFAGRRLQGKISTLHSWGESFGHTWQWISLFLLHSR